MVNEEKKRLYRINRNEEKKRRKAANQCYNCNETATKGKTLCQKHSDISKNRTKKLRLKRIKNGTCINCDQPLISKQYCQHHLDMDTFCRKKRFSIKKAKGICKWCDKPIIHTSFCLYHLMERIKETAKYYEKHKKKISIAIKIDIEKRKKNHQCTHCHIPLDDDIDKGCFSCINCREKNYITKQPIKGILDYAANKESSTKKLQHI